MRTAHLIRKTGARALVSIGEQRQRQAAELVADLLDQGVPLEFHLVLAESGVAELAQVSPGRRTVLRPGRASRAEVALRSFGPNDLSLLNSTSGTTALPKCVTQFDNRWMEFSRLAVQAGELGAGEVFLGAVPAPFGFGLWTSHYVPALLGAPTVVMTKFNVEDMIRLIQRERVTVLCCVSTQFRMLLNSPLANEADLSSLRVMFTGGEAVPYDRAAEFEERTGVSVLQFFGSNETGALSYTTLEDPRNKRLTTAGRLIPDMQVRLFDDDAAANQQLYTTDGWMLMGDLVTLDEDGYLSVVGRTSDIIIRGGKNVSAAQVEQEVETHPAVDLASVVAVPDPLYGERVCAVVSLRPGWRLELSDLVEHLSARNVSKGAVPRAPAHPLRPAAFLRWKGGQGSGAHQGAGVLGVRAMTTAPVMEFLPVQRQQVRLTYADCDPAHLVYYAEWLPKMEQMLREWFHRHGYRFDTMPEVPGVAPVTRSVHCEYTADARVYDLIEMVMGFEHVGVSSYAVGFRMIRQCDETVVACARLICVCTADGAAVPIPAALRRLMASPGER